MPPQRKIQQNCATLKNESGRVENPGAKYIYNIQAKKKQELENIVKSLQPGNAVWDYTLGAVGSVISKNPLPPSSWVEGQGPYAKLCDFIDVPARTVAKCGTGTYTDKCNNESRPGVYGVSRKFDNCLIVRVPAPDFDTRYPDLYKRGLKIIKPIPVPAPVPATVPATVPSPVPAPVSAPVPYPVPAPVPYPVPAPVPLPAPVSAPAPVPVPARVPAPVPVPVPSSGGKSKKRKAKRSTKKSKKSKSRATKTRR